ncbi:resolvase [Halorientalis sp. IM1011]|uniref:recombinase family protein n=1 Tax=Halorientalis sp. IM1011 TaxID=1932360 RepID=UPI00097CCEDC|nr:recombinase family protein [Halorientalis sp. IM1011]AQL41652.1 resolvase [Halorientalis sp. IM1011]
MSDTAIYARVSTEEQSLEGQKKSAWEYTTETLDVKPGNVRVLQDQSTGTDTDRSGYRELMELAKDGEIDRVVVREVSRIARNMRDLNRTVGRLVDDNDVSVHIIDADLHIGEDAGDGLVDDEMVLQLLGMAAELEAKLNKERTMAGLAAAEAAGKHLGRPPYGFDTDDEGYLVPNENFDTALAVIERIEKEDKSIRSTANHAGISRSAVRNIVDRKEMYLDEAV